MHPTGASTAPPQGTAWHSQSAEAVLAHLGSAATGLSAPDAAQRLATDGPNALQEGQRIRPLQIFLGQFKSLFIWMLIAAGVISGLLGERVDAIAILAIVVLNAVIGFSQECKSEKSIAALKNLTAPQGKVRRDGQVTSIAATGIVAGDILVLEAGDLVAADARLLEASSLRCIESALTGESVAVSKQAATLLELATILLGCNNAHLVQEESTWKVIGDPTEGALLAAGRKAGGNQERLHKELPKQHDIPFDSNRKRSSVIRRMPEGTLRAFINGAPDVLLPRCTHIFTSTGIRPITDQDRQNILAQNTAMARQALRVLGSASRDLNNTAPSDLTPEAVERELVFVGLTGMYDPPRPEGKDAVAQCRAAGIRVVMITGGHPGTATAIARELGIASGEDATLTGAALDTMSDATLQQRVPHIAVYTRVTAAHKLRIIRAWQANEAVVAMTGDGVNDAPAIQGADIGIAMGQSGTEVTRQASDMIITDDNFASIVAAVEEGRGIYDNIRKTLQYLLAGNTGELLLLTLCMVAGFPAPLLPIHLLWINLVTDGLPALCLATDPIDPDVMQRHPRRPSERLTDRGFLCTLFLTGFLTAWVTFAVYLYVLQTGTLETARTYAFAVLVFAELSRSFGARSETKPVWRIALFTNVNLVVVVAMSVGLQVWSQHNARLGSFLKTSLMPLTDGLLLLAVGAIPLGMLEMVKVVRHDRWQRKTEP